jgi:SAM-dependent methyltransferase
MRLMGNKLHDDQYYYDTALNEGERLINQLKVNGETEILEIGCSSGRSLIGLIQKGGKARRYVGFDSLMSNVDWCRKYISRKHQWCEFRYIDLRHQLFNKTGTVTVDQNFRMDVPDGSFDLIYVSSVLPNWDDHDLQIFVRDYYRILRPGGKVFVTNFIEEGVPKITENPDGYGLVYKYPRSVFRFGKGYFISLFTDAGFRLDAFEYGNEIDGQSSVFFSKPVS